MDPSLRPQPCRLLSLPNEVKLHIVDYIDTRRDLYNLSLTCRALEDIVIHRLYYNVDFHLPQFPLPGAVAFRDALVQSVRELTIRNGRTQRRNSVFKRRRISDAGSVEGHVNSLLEYVPSSRMTSFALLHQSPLGCQTLTSLAQRHERTLRRLHFYDIASWKEGTLVPRYLTSLEARTVNDGEAVENILAANRKSIERLSLGQEKQLIDSYQSSRLSFLQQIQQPLETLFPSLYRLDTFPQLRELSLQGLDLTPLRPSSIPHALFFCQLERFSLESCAGSHDLLESIAGTFHWASTSPEAPQNPRVSPSLKHFLFRHENPTTPLKEALVRFLSSFTGLRTLSLLLENGAILERPSTFIAEHGPTLETLVFESRIQPREHLSIDTSRPFGVGGYSHDLWEESINDIARLCPNLRELGMGFPWNDEMIRLRKTALPTLEHLRTIHIRNFPENQVFSQVGDYTIKEYATKFVEWVLPSSIGGTTPSLTHLAIGPTLYESRWKIMPPSIATDANASTTQRRQQATSRAQPPEFLRTHHFCLDWAKTRFNRWSCLITSVSENYMEEITGQKPLGGVFEQVWLR
ncbi:hypothetical protein AYO21_05021 [Fonsecaea monophora]|uniref:F-box domain-containing protein n=1 Tax=Fonsecaea monophora TaxID=254056 RepID=A0A177F922_9EURO|nr:hypothetical protein AYO21_05021 [Fonsecaea monophora]KAH0837533.1 hypothetical protein FOPE_05002 [Fonsecaea pedrosoi]OAG40723.1 hypothetical protein AYO21_05021 [Fonsecaea monophora]